MVLDGIEHRMIIIRLVRDLLYSRSAKDIQEIKDSTDISDVQEY